MASKSRLMAALSAGGWEETLCTILEAVPSITVIADSTGVILRASRYGCEVSGWAPDELEGLTIEQYVARIKVSDPDGRRLQKREIPLVRALKGERVKGMEGFYSHRSGERMPVVVNAAPFLAPDGEVLGAINSAADLRKFRALEHELRTAANEKALLSEELAHRVKNHLQMMSAVMRLEVRHAQTVVELSDSMSMRMKSLAAIYDRMNQADFGCRIVARTFIEDVVRPYRTHSIVIEVQTAERLTLSHKQGAPFGMLVNEAVSNSCKHAFPRGRGRIDVALRRKAKRLELEIADDGIGWKRQPDQSSHGLKLMHLHAKQLGGEMSLSNKTGGGARVVVTTPYDPLSIPSLGNRHKRQPSSPPVDQSPASELPIQLGSVHEST